MTSGRGFKLLKTIRFDDSDRNVYELAAEPAEWAVPGGFAFAGLGAEDLTGKRRQAFANGFLGLASFGRSTFAVVAEGDAVERAEVLEALAGHFVSAYGAPDLAAARPVAEEEIAFVESLVADQPINTVFTLRRVRDVAGAIKEEFRIIKPPSGGEPLHAKIWKVVGDDEA